MTSTVMDAVSILALDLGSANTRANLFDVADGQYRFIASGVAPSTNNAPYFDVGEGIFQALELLQGITGRIFLDRDANIILPSQAGGEGVDRLVVTYSSGKPLNIVTLGLLNDASLASVTRLAYKVPGRIVESFGINDKRSLGARSEALVNAHPDLILFAGGSNNGASRSVLNQADLICSAMQTIPAESRPVVVYAGNPAAADSVRDRVERYTEIRVFPNIRPEIDREDLSASWAGVSSLVSQMQSGYVNGLDRIATICNAPPEPSASGAEKTVRFLSSVNDPEKGILAFDIGSAGSFAIAGHRGATRMAIFPYGTGFGLEEFLKRVKVERIQSWMMNSLQLEDLRDALHQKTLSPTSIPDSQQALEIELAAARCLLREMVREMRLRGNLTAKGYDPILVSGTTLTRAASPQQILLTLLDGIQPAGITTLILDKYSILQSLGVAGMVQPYLPVQVLESTAFSNLATVVSVVSESRTGTEVINVRLEHENGSFVEETVAQGSIMALPLKPGESGKLYLHSLHRTVIEAAGLAEDFYKVNGGVLGVVIDARGRPLEMPANEQKRAELASTWIRALGS